MLILATVGVALTSVAIWSTIHAQNGFAEVVKMLKGQPAFIPNDPFGELPQSEFGEPGDNRLGPPNPDIFDDHPQLRPEEENGTRF